MRTIYLLIMSLFFMLFNWMCFGRMVDMGRHVTGAMFFINSIPWSIILCNILYAGHKYVSKK